MYVTTEPPVTKIVTGGFFTSQMLLLVVRVGVTELNH